MLISEQNSEEEPEAEQSTQPTAKIGTKKQRKLEEKQARKAQREVRGHLHKPVLCISAFSPFANSILGH